jgi:8-oxo-dGTP pyrophosphatase MutT (NUDIX family)
MLGRKTFSVIQRLVLQPLHRQRRGLTLGTRTAVLTAESTVLLVRHSYAPGWLFPGGGVERGEAIAEAACREVREETGLEPDGDPILHGLFRNDRNFPGDHVACFVVRTFSGKLIPRSIEIAEARFFPLDELPEDITGGTRRRLAEIVDGVPRSADW